MKRNYKPIDWDAIKRRVEEGEGFKPVVQSDAMIIKYDKPLVTPQSGLYGQVRQARSLHVHQNLTRHENN